MYTSCEDEPYKNSEILTAFIIKKKTSNITKMKVSQTPGEFPKI